MHRIVIVGRTFKSIRRKLWLGGIFGLAVLAPLSSYGLEFDQALRLAYYHNPALAAQRAALAAQEEEITQARAGFLPQIDVEASTGFSERNSNLVGAVDETLDPSSIGITLNQPLYRGGHTSASLDAARHLYNQASFALVAAEQNTLLEAARFYMDVIRDEALLDATENNIEVLRRQYGATQERFEIGSANRTDLSQARSRLGGAEASYLQALAALEASRAEFTRVIGQTPALLAYPDIPENLPRSRQEAVRLAQTAHPNIFESYYAEQVARDQIDMARSQMLPNITLTGQASHSRNQSFSGEEVDAASISLNLQLPLYRGGATISEIEQARHSLSQAVFTSEDIRTRLISEAIAAWALYQHTREALPVYQSQIDAAAVALEGVRQELQVGTRTVLQLLDSEQELLDARFAYIEAERDMIVAAYRLAAVTGNLTAERLGILVGGNLE